jgi:YVTN family beta-propeller protein
MTKIAMSAAALLAAALLSASTLANAAPFAYVTNAFAPSVSVVDTATNQTTATVAFPAGSVPFGVAITPDFRKVYVTALDAWSIPCGPRQAVYVIDAASNALEGNPIEVGCSPTSIAIAPSGKHAYVANWFSGTVSVIDTATNAVSATIPVPNTLEGIAISPDGQRVYVTSRASQDAVVVIDTGTNTVLETLTGIGGAPKGIAVSPDGRLVFVTNEHIFGTVTVIDSATNMVVSTIAVGDWPSAVALTPDGTKAYVTNGGGGTVSVIDTAAYAVIGSPITVGNHPNSIAITADGTQAYVGNESGNTVSMIDIASNTVTTTIGGMSSPRGVAARPIPLGILKNFTIGSAVVAGCKSVRGTVGLSSPAQPGGLVFGVSDTLAAAATPETVKIPEGATTKTFIIKTVPVAELESGTVTVSLGGVGLSQPLTVRTMGLSSVTLTPISVVGGQPVTGKATLECKAGPGPITVDLSSNNPAVANPVAASIAVPQTLQWVNFDVTTNAVQAKSYAMISGAANDIVKSKKLTVNVAAVASPTSLKFGSVPVGQTSAPLNTTLTNKGAVAFSVNSISVTGTAATWFAQTNNCPSSLAAGASCTIAVAFKPLAAASKSTKLTIATSATSTPLSVALSGTGT